MPKLQPYRLFIDETTRVNGTYWLSRYGFSRFIGVMRAIAALGHAESDPRVDQVWPSLDDGERRQITRPVSALTANLAEVEQRIRTTSLLYMCSAFENALAGYFVLGALYSPKALDPSWAHGAVPSLLTTPSQTTALVKKASEKAENKLKGEYAKRVKLLMDTFSITSGVPVVPSSLTNHYAARHAVAHDQALTGTDDPCRSASEIAATRVAVSEADWKLMLADFTALVTDIDSCFATHVVPDGGLALAVRRVLERDGAMLFGKLKHVVSTEWRIKVSDPDLETTAIAVGATIAPSKRSRERPVSL